MGEKLLSMNEVCKLLQLSEDQVTALVKQGRLRGFLDQKTYKFRNADVRKFREQLEDGGTVVLDDDSKADEISMREVTEVQKPVAPTDTDRVDLADIEGEPGADESDQTSVLAPVEDKQEAGKEPEPVFEFSEKDLGLSLDDEEAAESVLIADESESSVDILETVDETSSESATSSTALDLAEEESGSGEEVAAVSAEDEHATDAGVSDTVMEAEEGSDESLKPLDLDEIGEAGEALDVDEAEMVEEAEEIPLVGETETVGVGAQVDDTKVVSGALDVQELAEAADGTETVGVEGEALAEEAEEAGEIEEALPEAEDEEARIVRGWDLVVPWMPGNVMLAAAILFMVVASVFVFAVMNNMGETWGWAQGLIAFVEKNLSSQ